jgi:hypothetical protein
MHACATRLCCACACPNRGWGLSSRHGFTLMLRRLMCVWLNASANAQARTRVRAKVCACTDARAHAWSCAHAPAWSRADVQVRARSSGVWTGLVQGGGKLLQSFFAVVVADGQV